MSAEATPSRSRPWLTFEGLKHREDTKQRISKALSGRPKPPEVVKKISSVWEIVRPLILRGGIPIEVESVTDLSRKNINKAAHRRRPEWSSVPPASPQQLKEKRNRAYTIIRERKRSEKSFLLSEDQQKILALAKTLVKEGYFTDDLTNFHRLEKLYKEHKRAIPESFAVRLCCEYFIAARMQVQRDNKRDMIEEYTRLLKDLQGEGQSLCPDILVAEQKFIINAANNLS